MQLFQAGLAFVLDLLSSQSESAPGFIVLHAIAAPDFRMFPALDRVRMRSTRFTGLPPC